MIYLQLESGVDREAASLIVSFIAQLADLMNSVVIIHCDSDFALLIYKCLQILVFSNHSLFDLIRISVWRGDKNYEKKKFFYKKERRNVLSVLKNIGKNQYHAMLSSELEIQILIRNICELVNDFGDKRHRLVWISRRDVFQSLENWLLSSPLHFKSIAEKHSGNKQLKLISSKNGEGIVIFDRESKKESVNKALRNILLDKPLVEFVHSQNVRIVQYLLQVRILTRYRRMNSWRSDETSEGFDPRRSPSPLDEVDPEATLNFDVIEPIINAKLENEKETQYTYKQPDEASQSLIPRTHPNKYTVQSPDSIEMNYLPPNTSLTDTLNSIDPEIITELSDALTESLHCGNIQIVALMLKSICTYEPNSALVQFFDFQFLKKQYEESYRRDENYFRKLATDLGVKLDSNNCAHISAKFLDEVLDKLMYKNMFQSEVHQTLEKGPEKLRPFFQLYILIWGIVTQNFEIAELALRWYPCSNEQITTALAATRILDGIINLLKNDHQISTEAIQDLCGKKLYFENLSLQLLKEDECTIQEEEDEVAESIRLMREVSRTLPIDRVTSIRTHNRIPERKPTYTYTHNYNKKLEAKSDFWQISSLMMAHQGQCKLFIASEEVQGFVHKKNQEFKVKRKQLIDLVLFNLAFYIFHCLLSLKLVPEKENKSMTGFITYLVLLVVYGMLTMTFLSDSIARNLQRIKINIQNINALRLITLAKSSGTDSYIKAIFFLNFFIGYPLRIVEITKPEDFSVTISGIFFSINALILFIEVLKKALNLNRKLSLTIHLFISSIKKNMHFVILTFIFMFGFGIAQYILKCSQTSCLLHEESGIWDYFLWILLDPFKIMFGAYEVEGDAITVATSLRTDINASSASSYSAEWMFTSTAFMLLILLAIWQFISHIIIINLLIANFIKIYEEISNEADLLWKKELLKTYLRYKDWSFIPFFYLLPKPKPRTNGNGSPARSEVSNQREVYQPKSGRYWRQRDEEERRLLEMRRQDERMENIVLTLISSNYQARKHLSRIENYLEEIHAVPLRDQREDDDDMGDPLLGSFVI